MDQGRLLKPAEEGARKEVTFLLELREISHCRFQIQKYITKPDRRQLAASLGLTDAQVTIFLPDVVFLFFQALFYFLLIQFFILLCANCGLSRFD